uniref:Uncharacterized protein n=1 Tax=Anopheles albimanus TaxID=7167 RepID=A0A182FZ94_ANOAL
MRIRRRIELTETRQSPRYVLYHVLPQSSAYLISLTDAKGESV